MKMKEKKKRSKNMCGRCESENTDVTEKRFRQNVEVRYRCLKCGYEWSEYKQVR